MIKIVPDFYGSELTRGACETLALQRVDPETRAGESDLYSSKWFDYRLESWVHSTYRYAHEYKAAARRFWVINRNADVAEDLPIFPNPDIFQCRELTGCINARQALDRIGCRYEWALTWTLKRFSDRGWFGLPRPNQLYGEELTLDIADAWKEECAVSMQIARNGHFRNLQEGPQKPVQREYETWLVAQARARGVDSWRSVSRMLSEGVLTPAQADSHFGSTVAQRAQRIAALTT